MLWVCALVFICALGVNSQVATPPVNCTTMTDCLHCNERADCEWVGRYQECHTLAYAAPYNRGGRTCDCWNHTCDECSADSRCTYCQRWSRCIPHSYGVTGPAYDRGYCDFTGAVCNCSFDTCGECTANEPCVWIDSGGAGGQRCAHDSTYRSTPGIKDPLQCNVTTPCSSFTSCRSCGVPGCHWCYDRSLESDEHVCAEECPAGMEDAQVCGWECALKTTCDGCLESKDCMWCLDGATCVGAYIEPSVCALTPPLLAPAVCPAPVTCPRNATCSACVATAGCVFCDQSKTCLAHYSWECGTPTTTDCDAVCQPELCNRCSEDVGCAFCKQTRPGERSRCQSDASPCSPAGLFHGASCSSDCLSLAQCGACLLSPMCVWCPLNGTCAFAEPATLGSHLQPIDMCFNDVSITSFSTCTDVCTGMFGNCFKCEAQPICRFCHATGTCSLKAVPTDCPGAVTERVNDAISVCRDHMEVNVESVVVRYMFLDEVYYFVLQMDSEATAVTVAPGSDGVALFVSTQARYPSAAAFEFANSPPDNPYVTIEAGGIVLQKHTFTIAAACQTAVCRLELSFHTSLSSEPLSSGSYEVETIGLIVAVVVGVIICACFVRVTRRYFMGRTTAYQPLVTARENARSDLELITTRLAEADTNLTFITLHRADEELLALPIVGPAEAADLRDGKLDVHCMENAWIGIVTHAAIAEA